MIADLVFMLLVVVCMATIIYERGKEDKNK